MMKVEIKEVKISEIKLNPDNPRRIGNKEMERLVKSLQEFPDMLSIREIVVDETMTVLGGNMRLLALKKAGAKECTAKIVTGLTPEQKREFIIKDNSAFGEWDMDLLSSSWGDLPLVEWGVDLPEDWLVEEKTDPADAEPQIDRAAELNKIWKVKTGDLWQIGEHRLICGDCTDKAVVERVMGGEKAGCVFTDPPYGIDYSDLKGTFEKIAGDDKDPTELIKNSLSIIASGTHYVCCNWKSLKFITDALEEIGNSAKAVIVWDKGSRIQNLDKYGKRHEFIVYAGAYGGEKTVDDDLWQVNRETRKDHPTAKPTELIERAIKNETGIVYDPFLGSGTTMVACQNLNRKCYGIEISENYCAVILQRMKDAFPGIEIRR